jgi:hypothetical protein
MPDSLAEFKRLLSEFRGLSTWAVGGSLAVPFAAQLAQLSPPWPPAIVGVTAIVELLALVFVFQFLKTASRKRINSVLTTGALVLVIAALAYLALFSYFTYTTPGNKVRLVKGFVCTSMAAKVYKNDCPDLGMDQLNEAEYEAERLWTHSSILIARLGLTVSWLINFLALSAILGSFLVYQMRVRPAIRSKPKRVTPSLR